MLDCLFGKPQTTQAMIQESVIDQLKTIVRQKDVLTDASECWTYGYDNSRKHHAPDAVVFATTMEQVAGIVRLCQQTRIPLVAHGLGSGTTGGAIPVHGGLVVSLERMDRIIDIDADNRVMRVEAGVTNQAVQDAANKHGFFWAPDPTSAEYCSVGGNLAMNAAGPRAVKYGTTRENVLGLKAVTGNGDIIQTGVYTTKGVVGYDLTRLLIGSEGTMAIICEATLKLLPLPEKKITLQLTYDNVAHATAAISRIMAQAITPCALEFMDSASINMIREYSTADLPDNAGAILIIEVDGSETMLDQARDRVLQAAQNSGLLESKAANTPETVKALWQTRKALSPALRKVAPNKLNEDVVVPVSRIPELIAGLDDISRKFAIPIVNFGHAGNGNIHVNLLYDSQDPGQKKAALPCLDAVFDLVLKLDGTLSGEHGIGREKRNYINREIDPATLALMYRIKQQFDPNGILNPGKLFPDGYTG